MYANLTPRDYPSVCEFLVQVADSFVGRSFQLEGSGVPRERQGSRFLVCTANNFFSCPLSDEGYLDRAPCRDHYMGTYAY